MPFSIQFNFGRATQPMSEEFFYKLVRNKHWKNVIKEVRSKRELEKEALENGRDAEAQTYKNEANDLKKTLPGFIFQSTFLQTPSGKKQVMGAWRRQSATQLNGLCMIDVDHLADARATYEAFKNKVDFGREGIMLVYVTPSGHGLKIVFKARLEWGNLIDNQHQMARLLGIEVDEACKDSARLSFICTEQDVLFINNEIFMYENKEYGERWNEAYRRGDSQATMTEGQGQDEGDGQGATCEGRAALTTQRTETPGTPEDESRGHDEIESHDEAHDDEIEGHDEAHDEIEGHDEGHDEIEGHKEGHDEIESHDEAHDDEIEGHKEGHDEIESHKEAPKTYHGVPYHDIIDKWLEGRTPQEGDRHTTLLKLATQIRYICDRSAAKVTEVLKQERWVADYIQEDSSALTAIKDACEYKYSMNIPKKLQSVLAKVLPNEHQDEEQEYAGLPLASWGSKIEGMMADYPCLREVCGDLKKDQYPAALFASAAFFGTLMTRTWYHFYHLPEQERRLNYSIFIIGDPGSGKSFAGRLYNLIAAPIIMNDQVGNDAINRYKKEVKERSTSSKEQKKSALKQPTPIIRIHGTRTANGVFIEDMCNAVEIVGDKPMHLHMLTFDAELDASTAAAKGGQWIDKSTMELKAFHNEEDNQQYKNVDSVTGPFNVFWNFVYTGTPLSLDRKVTERNFGSGLSTRLACIPFPGDNLEMLEWHEQSQDSQKADTMLREWAFRLDKVSGELPIRELVRTTWKWTSDHMTVAKINGDKADGLLIKRIAYYGIAISMPFILMRHWEEWERSQTLTLDDKDLALANLAMNIQYECQRYFFGGYAERYFDNLSSERNLKGAKRKDKTINLLNSMNDEFVLEDLYRISDFSKGYIRTIVGLWLEKGLIEKIGRTKPIVYRKIG